MRPGVTRVDQLQHADETVHAVAHGQRQHRPGSKARRLVEGSVEPEGRVRGKVVGVAHGHHPVHGPGARDAGAVDGQLHRTAPRIGKPRLHVQDVVLGVGEDQIVALGEQDASRLAAEHLARLSQQPPHEQIQVLQLPQVRGDAMQRLHAGVQFLAKMQVHLLELSLRLSPRLDLACRLAVGRLGRVEQAHLGLHHLGLANGVPHPHHELGLRRHLHDVVEGTGVEGGRLVLGRLIDRQDDHLRAGQVTNLGVATDQLEAGPVRQHHVLQDDMGPQPPRRVRGLRGPADVMQFPALLARQQRPHGHGDQILVVHQQNHLAMGVGHGGRSKASGP